jgi:phospho-N-acetylmuramoyl-pentapeptide-transferase
MDVQALLLTTGAAFAIAVLLGPICIPMLHRLKFGQRIREEGPQSHQAKSGTPTMGGVMIMIALILTTLKFAFQSMDITVLLFATVAFGLIGFADDFIKVVKKRNLGLRAKQKLVLQFIASVVLFAALWWQWNQSGQSFQISVPFTTYSIPLGAFYILFLLVFLLATTNAVNLTDGLDGLLSGVAAIVFAAYAFYAYWHTEYDVAIFSAAMVGALLGFLVFNRHPAKVFMGDTGSLAIGGALAMVTVLTHSELSLVILGLVFVIETLSVIIQVFAFQKFGRRVFRMSPLHHHFELAGWSEWEVVIGFWLAAFITAFGGLALLSH